MAKGGYRLGAGRPGWHRQTYTMRTVDVRRLAREKLLYDGASFGWEWKDEQGKKQASIWIRVQGGGVLFEYTLNGKHDVKDVARLTGTPCNYGGTRQWFACPCCGGRCAVLYLGERVACRKCYQLQYPSQSDDVTDATWRKQRKLEAKLGGANYWRKPKGMHQATFDRIRAEIIDLEAKREEYMIVKWGHLLRLSGSR